MKQHLTLTNVLVVLLLLSHAYFIYQGVKDQGVDIRALEAGENIVRQNDSILSDNAKLRLLLESDRARLTDTVTVIKQQRTNYFTTYVKDINRTLNGTDSDQFSWYKQNSARFDSSFFAGQFNGE